jgi:hypothetical protein
MGLILAGPVGLSVVDGSEMSWPQPEPLIQLSNLSDKWFKSFLA